jgi:hypothetical protein
MKVTLSYYIKVIVVSTISSGGGPSAIGFETIPRMPEV